MFKKRTKAKQSTSGPPSQRPSLPPEGEYDANGSHERIERRDVEAERPKLSLEDLRSRYGAGVVGTPGSSAQGSARNHTEHAAGHKLTSDASYGLTQQHRDEIEEGLAEPIDEEWESEQLRKVGVKPQKHNALPTAQGSVLSDVAERLKRRINELNERAEALQKEASDLEQAL